MKTRKVLKLGNGSEAKIIEEQAPPVQDEDKRSKMLHVVSIASELGFSIAIPIAGGAFLGQILDGKFHTTPRITLSLIFLGVFIAGANIYLIIKDTKEK